MPINIARPSVASLLIRPESQRASLSTATGFVVETEGGTFLITNRHVVRGRHQDTDQPLHSTGGVPDSLRIVHNSAGPLGQWTNKIERLYDEDGGRLQLEHPTHGGKVDVVAVLLTELDGVGIYPYDPQLPPRVALRASEPLSIVGFPFGLTGGSAFAIWVRGFIATEIDVDFGEVPSFLIDSRTRQGQSGSPVIFYSAQGNYTTAAGGAVLAGGPIEEFVGVYSGRINAESDLGRVWKAAVVREIVEARQASAL